MKNFCSLILMVILFAACSSSSDSTAPPAGPEPVALSVPADTDITTNSVVLTWTVSTAGDFSLYAVVMESAADSVLVAISDRNTTQYEVQNLQPDTEYQFRVDVKSSDNDTGRGNTITVTTKSDFVSSTSPDLLMKNFKNAWEKFPIVEYEKLLDDQFQFFISPMDYVDLQQYFGPSWDRTQELATVGAMFRGDAGFDLVNQVAIPPILSIEFTTFAKTIDWSDPGSDPLYAGTLRARYKVGIRVTFRGVSQTTLVTGDQDFYVKGYPQQDGTTLYKIKVWEDQGTDTGAKQALVSAAGSSWGAVKAMYGSQR